MSLAGRFATFLYRRRSERLLEQARADVRDGSLPDAVARRVSVPVSAIRRPTSLRLVRRALDVVLARQGETHPCLIRALALLGDARRHGYAPSLAVGVRRAGSAVESHAWLVLEGRPFLESLDVPEKFDEIAILPPP